MVRKARVSNVDIIAAARLAVERSSAEDQVMSNGLIITFSANGGVAAQRLTFVVYAI